MAKVGAHGETRPVRTVDQLALDLPLAIQQAAPLFAAIVEGKIPTPRNASFIVSVFSDYRTLLHQRRAELIREHWAPAKEFHVYYGLIGKLLGCIILILEKKPVEKVDAAKICVFLRDLPSYTLLFN